MKLRPLWITQTVRRRVLWMSDDDWALVEECASARGISVGELVRRAFAVKNRDPKFTVTAGPSFTVRPLPPDWQGQRPGWWSRLLERLTPK